MGCLKLSYYPTTELKIISDRKVLTYNKTEINNRSSYFFGFNGKEQDSETYGEGNIYDYGFRIYNPRLGKFLSVDPLTQSFPWYTPYQFAGNKPIWAIDLDGLEEVKYTESFTLKDALLNVTSQSHLLNTIMMSIADPGNAQTIKVYFTQIELTPGTTAVTTDILGDYGLKLIERAEKFNNGPLTAEQWENSSPAIYDYYSSFMKNLEAMGLTIEDVKKMKEDNRDLQIWTIAVASAISQDDLASEEGEISALQTTFHEVDFHLKQRLDGVDQDGIADHKDAFDYENNKDYYEEKGWDPELGTSPDNKDAAPGSRAETIFKEIENTVKEN